MSFFAGPQANGRSLAVAARLGHALGGPL
ncbi:transcriptional regulator [Burkholderia thailandensis]|nr:transcriptional regulator [Burkholderia thailandensis]AOI50513.1 transcriptional regulator [Burkholderia thailandensis]AOJ49551.1 transcriptional regulator [Burkholderia thailandensis]AVR24925.1 transcriptional regulator [Burkholderia thailandensis]MDD1483925.1 transcriptional regulator [Burkholderia thailandensis]